MSVSVELSELDADLWDASRRGGEWVTANEYRKLMAENAKLRELVRAYQESADYPTCRLYDERKPDPFSHACVECGGDSCLIQRLTDELRELGIEVTE